MIRLNSKTAYQSIRSISGSGAQHVRGRSSTSESSDSVEIGRGGTETRDERSVAQLALQNRAMQRRNANQSGDDLRRVLSALPRDSQGRLNPEALVDESKKTSLSQAVERLVMEGLGTGADIAFEKAVHSLFAEYADDLGLDDTELQKARQLMLKEVREVVADNQIRPWSPNQPAPAMANIDDAIDQLQQRVRERRQTILEASGDLSRVLAELTVEASYGGESESVALGGFIDRMSRAIENRSTFSLKRAARQRLLSMDVTRPTEPGHQDLADAFLNRVKAS